MNVDSRDFRKNIARKNYTGPTRQRENAQMPTDVTFSVDWTEDMLQFASAREDASSVFITQLRQTSRSSSYGACASSGAAWREMLPRSQLNCGQL